MAVNGVVARATRGAARIATTPGDVALAAGAAVLLTVDIEYTGVHPLLGYGVAVPAMLSLAWRRRAPVVIAIVVCATNLMLSLASTNLYGAQTAGIAVVLAVYTVASRCDGRLALIGGAITLPLVVAAHAATKDGDLTDFLGELVWGAAWLAGRVVRRRTLEAARIATDATLRAQQREEDAREAVSRERDRIARELHDVVAHAVSLVVVQAGAERLALGATAARTRGVLDAIETAGRQALVELRAMLAVLRTDGEAGFELGPQPDLDALPALVERVREAGLPIDVHVDLPAPLPPGVGLSAYRIVQESLTNALKHSPTSAAVSVRASAAEVVIEVRNPRAGAATNGSHAGSGRGLVGMRERAALHAGELTAGPEGHDWVVRARLPLTPAAAVTG